jgi:hypothetical protein
MQPSADPVLWHYTLGLHLPDILRSGVLRPGATVPGEWPAVWFSFRRGWEPAAGTGLPPSEEETRRTLEVWATHGLKAALESRPKRSPAELGGLVRIGVRPRAAPFTWDAFVRLGGIPPSGAQARVTLDRALGSDPADWRVSLLPVPASEWIAIEGRAGVRAGESWEPIATGRTRREHGLVTRVPRAPYCVKISVPSGGAKGPLSSRTYPRADMHAVKSPESVTCELRPTPA